MKQTVAGIDYCKLNKYHGLDLYSKLQESFIIFKDCANSRLASKNDIFVFECEHGTSDVYSKSFMRNIGEIKKTLLVLRMVAEKKTSREIMRSCTREFLNKIRNLYNTAAPSKIASPEQQVNEVFQFHVLDFYIKNIVETEV
ncbi:unnamed protein product [Caenorhabditis angaria]|uniref:Uncharacterized protein n=1 Tax=Caenorhabditis angaria TaxID=860376 RepID=A0A9P1MYU3_9PELO|nr:unnamed protein product [Caenorhabditis angaria]